MPLSGVALVTGGAGFIGSHIAAALIERGARVRIYLALSSSFNAERIDYLGTQEDRGRKADKLSVKSFECVLVTGGAATSGAWRSHALRQRGERVVVLDNLSRGHRAALPKTSLSYHGAVGDRALVRLHHPHS